MGQRCQPGGKGGLQQAWQWVARHSICGVDTSQNRVRHGLSQMAPHSQLLQPSCAQRASSVPCRAVDGLLSAASLLHEEPLAPCRQLLHVGSSN